MFQVTLYPAPTPPTAAPAGHSITLDTNIFHISSLQNFIFICLGFFGLSPSSFRAGASPSPALQTLPALQMSCCVILMTHLKVQLPSSGTLSGSGEKSQLSESFLLPSLPSPL